VAATESRDALRRLRRLRRVYHVSFVVTVAAAAGFCSTAGAASPPVHGSLLAAIVLPFLAGLVAQALVWRTRCPSCNERFFARSWSPSHTWAGFPTDESCDHCRFNLYRATRVPKRR